MDIKVKSSYLKISPRKMRPVLFSVRGKKAEEARTSLLFTNKKGAKMLASLIKSALAIAKENDLELDKMQVKSVYCSEGPKLKRRQIKARGRADSILKRMSHLFLEISDEQLEETIKEEKNINKGKIKLHETKKENK